MSGRFSDVDVVVVGAGAAGLAAARELRRAKASHIVLEARGRAGGRGWTLDVGGFPLDMGCGWLHSAKTNPFVDIVDENGVELDRSAAPWQKPSWTGNFPLADQEAYRAEWERFHERLAAGARDAADRPASDFLTPGHPANPMLDAGSTFINGVELAGLSTIDYERYVDTGVNWRAPTGFGALIARLGAGSPVEYNCPVSLIDHSAARPRIETPRGAIHCRAAIVTASTNLIATRALRFSPRLPEKTAAADKLPLGLADKLFLRVERADDLPLEGRVYGARDTTAMASYHTRPFGRPLVECYFGGAFARELENAGERAFADFAVSELAAAFGSNMRGRLKPLAASRWASDPFALGSYSHARVGCAEARDTLAAPVEDRIFFAGEACSRHDFSTAHGAFRTGVAAARAAMGAIT